jgi:chemotaxis protein methyltransferase CheR
VVEAMTTNETFFFRDKVPFEHFRDLIMPHLLGSRANRKTVRIWCAAGSTGQEPYSLAMSLREMGVQLAGWRVEIIATDLSQEVLEKSRAGLYSQFEVQRGLPIQLLVKYFKQVGELWQINAEIRAMVQHRQLNLLQDFSQLGVFDLIFCRNVLIYFDQERRKYSTGLPRRWNRTAFSCLAQRRRWLGSPPCSSRWRSGAASINQTRCAQQL